MAIHFKFSLRSHSSNTAAIFLFPVVIPAQAGIQERRCRDVWTRPALPGLCRPMYYDVIPPGGRQATPGTAALIMSYRHARA